MHSKTKHQLDCIPIRKESQMADTKIMSKKRFPIYKNYVANLVEQKRVKDKDWAYLTCFIKSFIANDTPKYAFTGKQIKELLDLAN